MNQYLYYPMNIINAYKLYEWSVSTNSNTMHVKFGANTSQIPIDSCVFKALFTSVHLQSVSLKPSRPTILYFVLYIVLEQVVGFAYLRTREGGFYFITLLLKMLWRYKAIWRCVNI